MPLTSWLVWHYLLNCDPAATTSAGSFFARPSRITDFLDLLSSVMISQDLLALLRCPMDPSHTTLADENGRLVCQCCRLAFPIRDGLPMLLVEEAELPEGCNSLEQLPCQRERTS